ncbi:hypothetical protein WH47_08481 [Habropoda laboriosa]|uniref:Uncharacterized protein n=1 Tax=Habropoda laboriosa TaxID=597456 RepID=A0A0L7QN76_9HYME|nr:hypothetical protein WH47_08481 [Habropoda laboriosa]
MKRGVGKVRLSFTVTAEAAYFNLKISSLKEKARHTHTRMHTHTHTYTHTNTEAGRKRKEGIVSTVLHEDLRLQSQIGPRNNPLQSCCRGPDATVKPRPGPKRRVVSPPPSSSGSELAVARGSRRFDVIERK